MRLNLTSGYWAEIEVFKSLVCLFDNFSSGFFKTSAKISFDVLEMNFVQSEI